MHIFYRFGRHGASSGLSPAQAPTVDDIAPSEIASLTADGRAPVVYAASALGRLEPASTAPAATSGVDPSAPIATAAKPPATLSAVKAMAPAADKPAVAKAIPVSTDRAPLEGLKTTVGAGSGAAS